MQDSATILQVLFDISLWIVLGLSYRRAYNSPYTINKGARIICYLLILLFCLSPFWSGDYFHYNESFEKIRHGGFSHWEPIYQTIALFVPSYFVFRLVVWGVALFLLQLAYKKSSPTIDLCVFIFCVCYLHMYSYARASAAMTFIVLGLSVLANSQYRSRILSIVLGFGIIGCSVFFHRSAAIGVAAAIASLFLVNANKKTIIILVLLSPVIVYTLQYSLGYFMTMDLDDETYITDRKRDNYMVGGSGNMFYMGGGLGAIIYNVLTRVPLYLSAILYVITVVKGQFNNFTIGERIMSSYAFSVIVLGLCFLIDFGYNTYVLHYRTLNYSMIANAVFLAAVRRHSYNKKLFNVIIYSTMFGAFYMLAYAAYRAI